MDKKSDVGISLRFIRKFDAEQERADSLKRAQAEAEAFRAFIQKV